MKKFIMTPICIGMLAISGCEIAVDVLMDCSVYDYHINLDNRELPHSHVGEFYEEWIFVDIKNHGSADANYYIDADIDGRLPQGLGIEVVYEEVEYHHEHVYVVISGYPKRRGWNSFILNVELESDTEFCLSERDAVKFSIDVY